MSVEAQGLQFSFGSTRVLRGLDLSVERGTVTALFGPNGAGKTTLLKVLAGLLRPEAGTVRIEGAEPRRDPVTFRRLVGVVSHQPYVYPQLTGRENLDFYGRLYGLSDLKAQVAGMLAEMGLDEWADRPASAYSRGLLQRLAIGRALLHKPAVLLLDEAFTGLDELGQERLESLLASLRDGRRTVLLSSHDLGSGLRLADRVAVLHGGRVVLDDAAKGLEQSAFAARYREVIGGGPQGSSGGRA